MNSSFRLRPELSLCMRSSFHSNLPGKIVKLQNDCAKISEVEFSDTKIFETSFNFDLKTSCALPPYYSLELDPISSTSHSNLSRGPGSRFTWVAASAKRKFIFQGRKLDELWYFGMFCSILSFSQFRMVLGWFHYEFRIPGAISCPGVVSDRPGVEFSLKMKILLRT